MTQQEMESVQELNRRSVQLPEAVRDFRREHQPSPISPAVEETDFAELEDGSLVEIVEDPENSSRTLLAIYKDGEVRFTQRFQSGNRVLVPIPRYRHVIRHVRLPRGVKTYESVYSLLLQTESILSRCLDLSEAYRCLLANFVLSTWFIEKLPVAPYVALVGLPRSGKSTALGVLRLLCRRSLLTADITSAAFYRVCDRLTPTLLIDETSTAGERRILFHLLRTGTTRDAVALRRDESFKTFGPKVISWTELPNDAALNSRCMIVPLHETHRTDLVRPTDPEIVHAAEDLQRQLLQYRFEKFKTLKLPKVQGDDQLHSRTRDLYEALALPAGENTMICEWLARFFKTHQDSSREALSPMHAAILQTLFRLAHMRPEENVFLVQVLADRVNYALRQMGENFRVSPREVGAGLTSLGFRRRKRTSRGWSMLMNQEVLRQIHTLVGLYGLDREAFLPSAETMQRCDLCKGLDKPMAAIWGEAMALVRQK